MHARARAHTHTHTHTHTRTHTVNKTGQQNLQNLSTHYVSCYVDGWVFKAASHYGPIDGAVERVAGSVRHHAVGATVVAHDASHVSGATSRHSDVHRDPQRGETVVVVGEERNLEATVAAKEVSALAAGDRTHCSVDQVHSIVEHVDATISQLVLIFEVDAEKLPIHIYWLKVYVNHTFA